MISDFKTWLNGLAVIAMKRKDVIELKTGKRPKWNNKVNNNWGQSKIKSIHNAFYE